jgi:hypothetical protein
MVIELIDHNNLDDKYTPEFEKIKKTEKYIATLKYFPYNGVIMYLIILDKQLIGYVFIGKTEYGNATIILNLILNLSLSVSHSGSTYKNILKEIITKYRKINRLLNSKSTLLYSLVATQDKPLNTAHLEYGFNFVRNIDDKLNLYSYTIGIPTSTSTRISSRTHTSKSSKTKSHKLTKKNPKSIVRGYDNCYILSTRKLDGLIFTSLQSKLEKYGLLETRDPKTTNTPLLLWREHLENYKYDPKYSNTHSWIMNILSDTKTFISNKSNLYNNFYKHYPKECLKYMAQTWNFKQNPHQFLSRVMNSREVFIVRPAGTGAFSGKGIVVVHNRATFNEALKNSKNYEKVIISKYITDPLLFQNRKFHLRTYLIAGVVSGQYVAKFLDFYELYHALKPYHNSDYSNHDIHDTHFGSTDQDYICPQDLPKALQTRFNKYVYPNMRVCMLFVAKMFSSVAKPYPESQNAFEIFGCDFLVRDNNEVVLMEINDRIGFKKYTTEKRIEFSKLMLDVIYKGFLLPMLEPTYKIPKDFWLYPHINMQ